MGEEELDVLQKNFKAFIQPHLAAMNAEDCELVWQWEKFIFDKGHRINLDQTDRTASPLLRARAH